VTRPAARIGEKMKYLGVGIAVLIAVGALGVVGVGADDEPLPETLALGDVSFPHQLHFDDFGIECSECHHETDAAQLSIPHPSYFEDFWIDCQICHHAGTSPRESQKCSSCHPEAPFSIADETLSAKVVIHQSCWSCHEVGKAAEASTNCAFCHSKRASPTKDTNDGAKDR
jgi:hypothetical protein